MSWWFLVAGIAIGIAVAAPIGPVNVICIQRAIRSGFWPAFFTGLGAACGDTLFGIIAAFGLSTVSSALMKAQMWLAISGAVMLLIMGFVAWRSKPHLTRVPATSRDILHAAMATFALTITNPITALGFVALFTSIGLTRSASMGEAATAVAGVAIGSVLWWVFICRMAYSIRERLADGHLLLINRGTAIVIWGFAAFSLYKAFTAG